MILRGKWRRQFIVILGFYFFDYVSTTLFCRNPSDEWNIVARTLMIGFNSVPIGMTMFFLMIAVWWYIVTYMISWYTNRVKESRMNSFYRLLLMGNFMVFALIAAWDFGFGATSWFWPISIFWRALVGLAIYTAIYLLWVDRATPNA